MVAGFRSQLIKQYKSCLLTRFHASECDGAHIIPQWVCYKFPLTELVSDPANGLLLSTSLHSTFDRYLWTFDVHNLRPVKQVRLARSWAEVPVLVRPNRYQRLINQYQGVYFKIPLASLPYLWVHYQMFLIVNYRTLAGKPKHPGEIPAEIYGDLLASDSYLKIQADPWNLARPEEFSGQPLALIKKRGYGAEYLVVWDGRNALDEAEWVGEEKLDPEMINDFEQRRALELP